MSQDNQIGKIPQSSSSLSNEQLLRQFVYNGYTSRCLTDSYKQRLEYELELITANEVFVAYLLFMNDLVKRIKQIGGVVGPGCYTAGNSLVNFCLGITEINPIKFQLTFDNYYWEGRQIPNIFLMLNKDCECDMFAQLCNWYGDDNVARVVSSEGELIEPFYVISNQNLRCCEQAKEQYIYEDDVVPTLVFQEQDIESNGFIKTALLGMESLDELKGCNLQKVPLDDEYVYEKFKDSDCVDNHVFIHQNLIKYLKQVDTLNFSSLLLLKTMFRPGLMQHIPTLITRCNEKQYQSDNTLLEQYLKTSYGFLIYDEQGMEILQKIANFTPLEARLLKFVLRKKDKIQIERLRELFINKGKQNHHNDKDLENAWKLLALNYPLCQPKAHFIEESLIAYWQMYFRVKNNESSAGENIEYTTLI